jgi:hypothetical protein
MMASIWGANASRQEHAPRAGCWVRLSKSPKKQWRPRPKRPDEDPIVILTNRVRAKLGLLASPTDSEPHCRNGAAQQR